MKLSFHIIAVILASLLIVGAIQVFNQLPADSQPLIEKKYSSWSGVLRAWICSRWECDGSFNRWLNLCASDFEKSHPGVYIECTTVSEKAINDTSGTALRAPELMFFSPAVLQDPSILEPSPVHPDPRLRNDNAVAVCMGVYTCVLNTELTNSAPDLIFHLPDEPGCSFSLASKGFAFSGHEISLVEPGIDLGLPASADSTLASLSDFIHGEIPSLVISQRELSRLVHLREDGLVPDWVCASSAGYIYTDQLLLGGVVSHQDADASARTPLAHEFLLYLLSDECQMKLSEIGAFSSTGVSAYPPTSAFAVPENLLQSLPLVTPPFF